MAHHIIRSAGTESPRLKRSTFDRVTAENCLRFRVGTKHYRAYISNEPLRTERGLSESIVYFDERRILISPAIRSTRRTDALFFSLRCAWHHHHGRHLPITMLDDARSVSQWAINMARQFGRQGGERALMALKPWGKPMAAEQVAA